MFDKAERQTILDENRKANDKNPIVPCAGLNRGKHQSLDSCFDDSCAARRYFSIARFGVSGARHGVAQHGTIPNSFYFSTVFLTDLDAIAGPV